MDTFQERQKGYESRFAHELELDFKIRSKRNKMLGLWAANQMHLKSDDAENYADEVVASAVGGVAHETVMNKVLDDLREKGVKIKEEEVLSKMDSFLAIAEENFR